MHSCKGGVGKSSIAAGLAYALRDKGYRVGLLDIDVSSSGLHRAMGLDEPPELLLDTKNEQVIPPEVNGVWVLPLASHFGEEVAVIWHGDALLEKTEYGEIVDEGKEGLIKDLLSDQIAWPPDLDFLIADLPPALGEEIVAFFKNAQDLLGVILVSQPTGISSVGLSKTIDFIRVKRIPIIGLVSSMEGYLCPHCKKVSHQYLSPSIDLKEFAGEKKIPFLCSIPQSPDMEVIKPWFNELAEKVLRAEPVTLKEVTRLGRLKRAIAKQIARRI